MSKLKQAMEWLCDRAEGGSNFEVSIEDARTLKDYIRELEEARDGWKDQAIDVEREKDGEITQLQQENESLRGLPERGFMEGYRAGYSAALSGCDVTTHVRGDWSLSRTFAALNKEASDGE